RETSLALPLRPTRFSRRTRSETRRLGSAASSSRSLPSEQLRGPCARHVGPKRLATLTTCRSCPKSRRFGGASSRSWSDGASRLRRRVALAEVAADLTGQRCAAVDRRGKYLIVRFESGLVLLIPLRMTGTLAHSRNGGAPFSHLRAVVRLDDGSDVMYRDVRRFGTWLVLRSDELDSYLSARLRRGPP